MGKLLNVPDPLSREADSSRKERSTAAGGCKGEREPPGMSHDEQTMAAARNFSQLRWGGEVGFELSPNDFCAFGSKTNSCVCASFHSCALELV